MSWMADMEYRLNLVVRIVGELAWYTAQLSVFEVLYTHTSSISGWDVHAMRVFMGTLFLTDVFYLIFFIESLDSMAGLVKRGDLDLYLTKPVVSQFMISFRKVSVVYVFNLLLILAYLLWGIRQLPGSITWMQVLSYCVIVVSGIVSLYSMRFMFATLSVLLHDAGNIQFVWYQLYRLGTRPDPIYPPGLRLIVLTVFPVAFFASVPARVLIEGIEPRLLLAAPVLAVGLLFLSHLFWERALRQYSSASS